MSFPYGPADPSVGLRATKHALWEAIYYYAMNPLPLYQRDKTLIELSIKCMLDARDIDHEERERKAKAALDKEQHD